MTGCNVAVPNGKYQVTLRFSENQYKAANKRVFDVRIEGATILTSFDIFVAASNAASQRG